MEQRPGRKKCVDSNREEQREEAFLEAASMLSQDHTLQVTCGQSRRGRKLSRRAKLYFQEVFRTLVSNLQVLESDVTDKELTRLGPVRERP